MTDWQAILKAHWRIRDAHIERAVRTLFAERAGPPLTTKELAVHLSPVDVAARKPIMERLRVMAPYMPNIARHDGKVSTYMGKPSRGWTWAKREDAS